MMEETRIMDSLARYLTYDIIPILFLSLSLHYFVRT